MHVKDNILLFIYLLSLFEFRYRVAIIEVDEFIDLHFPDSDTCSTLVDLKFDYWCNNGSWAVSVYDNATQTESYRTIDAIYAYVKNGVSFFGYPNISHTYIHTCKLVGRSSSF